MKSRPRSAYLDYNATAPLRPEAREAAIGALSIVGNPSSVHGGGRRARAILEGAREKIARIAKVEPTAVTFTSGATEGANWVIQGLASAGLIRRLIVSGIEHDCVLRSAEAASRRFGLPLRILAVRPNSLVDLEDLAEALDEAEGPALVAVMSANNETGVLQPQAEAITLTRARGGVSLCDAVQTFGRHASDPDLPAADFEIASAHKLGGLMGAGVVIARGDLDLPALLQGGRQENGLRAGTENLPAIAAFGAAVEAAKADCDAADLWAGWRDRFEAGLAAEIDGLRVFGAPSPRLPHVSCLSVAGTLAETLVIALDLAGVEVSAGSACSSGKLRPSHVLAAMGESNVTARSAIRVSFGWATEEAELERCADALAAHIRRQRRASDVRSEDLQRA